MTPLPDFQYPDLKEMLKELASDLKESYRKDLQILESNLTNSQLKAIQEARNEIVEVERKQDMMNVTHKEHGQKIVKLFTIVDEIRDGYQQAVGAFKLWGMVCGAAAFISSAVAIYTALK